MSSPKSSGGARRPRYSPEFKADAVALVIEGERSIADVAKSLGLVEQTLGNWVKASAAGRLVGVLAKPVTAEQMEPSRLRAECARLKMHVDISRRATACLAEDALRSTPGSTRSAANDAARYVRGTGREHQRLPRLAPWRQARSHAADGSRSR